MHTPSEIDLEINKRAQFKIYYLKIYYITFYLNFFILLNIKKIFKRTFLVNENTRKIFLRMN